MSQTKPKLIVMSGLPGCGKSTIARLIAREVSATILSVDPIESAIYAAGLVRSFETGYAAYLVAEAMACEQLTLGLTVLIDAVNAEEEGKDLWRRLAVRNGAMLVIIEVTLADRDLHRARVEARVRGLPGFSELRWDEVEARRNAYTKWREPTLVIDTYDSSEQNARKAVAYIRAS
jgi:predicted kinase